MISLINLFAAFSPIENVVLLNIITLSFDSEDNNLVLFREIFIYLETQTAWRKNLPKVGRSLTSLKNVVSCYMKAF
jgi:small neutral amino acid transporter SnatA (MarC family)